MRTKLAMERPTPPHRVVPSSANVACQRIAVSTLRREQHLYLWHKSTSVHAPQCDPTATGPAQYVHHDAAQRCTSHVQPLRAWPVCLARSDTQPPPAGARTSAGAPGAPRAAHSRRGRVEAQQGTHALQVSSASSSTSIAGSAPNFPIT